MATKTATKTVMTKADMAKARKFEQLILHSFKEGKAVAEAAAKKKCLTAA